MLGNLMVRNFALFALFVSSQAFAQNAPYVGLWAEKMMHCKRMVGDGSDSPTKITRSTIEGWEYLCSIKNISKSNAGCALNLSCASEGNESTETMRFQLTPDGKLHQSGSYGDHLYVRCKR